ncbi:MAG TPA: HAD-IIIC family phosphatase [Phycisphaerae bacterium]|nr:HAD-IIIC family phosphatase [Phycisphaerae bacterium]
MPELNSQPKAEITDAASAIAVLDAVAAQPTLVRINQAGRQIDALADLLGRVPLRLACLSSFTMDPLKASIELHGLRAGFRFETYVAPYGRFEQELIDPSSGLNAGGPQAVLLAVRLPDVCPALYDSFNGISPREAGDILGEWFTRLGTALRTFRERSSAPVLMQNYEMPLSPALGIADAGGPHSQASTLRDANARLQQLSRDIPNLYVMDYDGLVARVDRERWCDPRTRLFARIPVASGHYWRLAGFYVSHLRPLFGLSKKVLVLDADNTLWGGVIGDVGLNGIQLGQDFPGNAFVEFQKRVLDLHQRGVILAIASKNEPGSVEQVLAEHPQMVLRARHFASTKVSWNPKPPALREIADELNLGIDSFVFMDDSPVECDLMRKSLPEVLTVQLPADPAGYSASIDALDCFEQWTISEEDRKRGELYQAETGRRQLQAVVVDMPAFYRQLEMAMTLYVNHLPHVGRASQMTNRTNQFNMHTVRCTEDDIRRFMTDDQHWVVTVALADRFGDNGVIGMAVVDRGVETWRVPLFLMSCRILGRTVEQSFLRWIAEKAREAGGRRLEAEFVPTAKNRPFSGFFEQCGLRRARDSGDIQLWEANLAAGVEPIPDWIRVAVE